MKHTFKAPVPYPLNLKYEKLLTSLAFKFNLRRYTKDIIHCLGGVHVLFPLLAPSTDASSPFPSTATATEDDSLVGRCRLTLSNPR
jgi:hypothetical protein